MVPTLSVNIYDSERCNVIHPNSCLHVFYHTQSSQNQSNHEFTTFVQWVHGQCPVSPWTQWTLSMDIFQSAWTPWTLSRVSMDNAQTVHWVHGQCPLSLWTMPTESMDIIQSGWSHWTFVHGLTRLCPEYPWTVCRLSSESMVNVHWVHGQCPGCQLSPWTFYRWVWEQVSVKYKYLYILDQIVYWLTSVSCVLYCQGP